MGEWNWSSCVAAPARTGAQDHSGFHMCRQHRDHLFRERGEIVPFILDGNDDGGPWAG